MNVYTQDEVERINKIKETNDRLETFFQDKRSEWNKTIEPLYQIEFEKLVKSKESEFIWNSRFLIQEINGTLVNDNKGHGFKTRRRAYNVLKYNLNKNKQG